MTIPVDRDLLWLYRFEVMPKVSLIAASLLISSFSGESRPAAADPSVRELYQVPLLPTNIAGTVGAQSYDSVEVFGQPRMALSHPNVFWDQVDIDHYKEMLKSSQELKLQFFDLKRRMDERIARPLDIPPPRQGPDGAWLYPGDYFPPFPGEGHANDDDAVARFRLYLARDSEAISDLGTLYALTSEAKYAQYARDILLAYSNCSRYGPHKTLDYRSRHGLAGQLLDEALILDKLARGYDLIYNYLTAQDRARIHDELLRPLASEMLYPGVPEQESIMTFSRQVNNRGAIGAVSVLLTGYATDDQELVNAALYGVTTNLVRSDIVRRRQFPPPQDWIAATPDHPGNGLLSVFFAPPAIPGGMWVEGSLGYSFYALASLINAADAAWHHGLDLYRHNNCIFKHMFDFPLLLAYPDMTIFGENDSRRDYLRTGYIPTLYEYGYRRYRDPRYLAIINSPRERAFLASLDNRSSRDKAQSLRYLSVTRAGGAPPSVLYDLDPKDAPRLPPPPSVNFPGVGFGILRASTPNDNGLLNLTLSYGPKASHGHPDKLHIDLYAFGDVLMPSPGINFPYAGNTLIEKWYHTTLAHNTLVVDEKSQEFDDHNKDAPPVHADQAVYAPAEGVSIQRASTDSAYPGVMMDRAVFLTKGYLADIFGAFSDTAHQYDLAWHIRGAPTSGLNLSPAPFPDPIPNGYSSLLDVRQSQSTNDPWSVTYALGDHVAKLLAAGGTPTQAILAEGGVYSDATSDIANKRPTAPTVLERREGLETTIFGNVLDLSDDGYVKSVNQEGDFKSGFALLKIEKKDGVDLCFASYRPGKYTQSGLETDALQAVVQLKGSDAQALYLGGGTFLKFGDAFVRRSETGLAYLERTPDGGYIVSNPSPTPARLTLKLPALSGFQVLKLDDQGRPTGKADAIGTSGGEVSVNVDAASRVEISPETKLSK
jgi:hypothetical protein